MEYVSRVGLEVNGQVIEDFDSVEEKEIDVRKAVPLMNKTGSCELTPRYGVSVNYVIPKDGPEFNFKEVADATLVIDRLNGTRISFSGVYSTKIGTIKYGEDAAKRTIELIANGRSEE